MSKRGYWHRMSLHLTIPATTKESGYAQPLNDIIADNPPGGWHVEGVSTSHKFTARIKLVPAAQPIENKIGDGWSVQWHADTREATVEFHAPDATAALMRLHFIVQRKVRGVKVEKQPRAHYPPDAYQAVSMRSGNGSYDLPRQKNPDLSTVDSRREFIDGERDRMTPKYEDVKVGDPIETQAVLPV